MRLLSDSTSHGSLDDASDLTTSDLLTLYALDDDVPTVRANMVVSLDGRTAGSDHLSGSLSSAADRTLFSVLRSLSDVVLVGAGTARAESYRPARVREDLVEARAARGRREPPIIALVSRSLAFDEADPLFSRGRTLFITGQDADPDAVARAEAFVEVVRTPTPDVDLRAAIDELRRRGLLHVVCEGGPHLLADALAQDVVDELCLTISPTVVGGDGHRLLGGDASIDARFVLGHVLEEDSVLMTRFVRQSS